MTVTSPTARVSYAGDGSTILFPVSFKFLANADLVVLLVDDATGAETPWTLGTQYSLTGAGEANGGTLTVTTSPTDYTPETGETLVIYRDPARTQAAALPLGGPLPSTTIERMADKLTMLVQRVHDIISRSLRQPDGDTTAMAALPVKVERASMYLAFDADGDPIASPAPEGGNVVSSFIETLLDDTDAAAARTTLGALGSGDAGTVLTGLRAQGLDTIWVPAVAMYGRITNGATAGVLESTTNKVISRSLDFDQTTQEFAQFAVQFPKSWNEGTVTFAPVWSAAAGSGGVVWALQAVALSDDDALDTAFGTEQTSTDTLIATGDVHVGPTSAAITIAGSPAAGDWVAFQIKRNVSDGSDTLSGDARLLGVRIFFTTAAANDA
jgi:hypothetical protein